MKASDFRKTQTLSEASDFRKTQTLSEASDFRKTQTLSEASDFRKTQTLSEAQIQKAIADYLQLKKWLVVRMNSGSMKDPVTNRFTRFYTIVNNGKSAGLPDLLAMKDGRVMLFEVKTKTGRLTDSQKQFIDSARRYGIGVHVVRSVAEVERLVA